MLRNWAVPLAVALVGVMLTVVALKGGEKEGLDVDINVLSATDPHSVGAITTLQLEVTNRSSRMVTPRFSVEWAPYPFYWRVVSGPPELRAKQTATYAIEAPDSTAAVPKGTPFQVRVNDGGSIVYAVSAPVATDDERVSLINPSLRLWSKNPGTGLAAPFGWQAFQRIGTGDEVTITPEVFAGVSAIRFDLRQNGQEDPGGWAHAGILQEALFPAGPMEVLVNSRTPFAATAEAWPLTAFGIEVSDGENPLLWFLFQPNKTGDLSYDLPNGHHIEVISVPDGVWTKKSIDVAKIYQELHWAPRKKVLMKAFIAVASTHRGQVVGHIAEVNPMDAALPAKAAR